MDAGIAAQLRAGRAAYPAIEIDPDEFARELARRADGAVIADLKGADVYLAIACGNQHSEAIAIVRSLLVSEVAFAARKTTASADQLAEVTANLSRVLFVDEGERPAAVRNYSGRGELKSYVRVIAMREVMRVVNLGRREVAVEDNELFDRLVPASDPELSILRARYREDVDIAMRAAVATLDERGRALLRYAFVDGWTVDRIGELYDVHRATAARWVAAVRERLGDEIRTQLAARLKVDTDEVDSIVRMVQSRIDVSLDRMLR